MNEIAQSDGTRKDFTKEVPSMGKVSMGPSIYDMLYAITGRGPQERPMCLSFICISMQA